jgi:integrase
MKRTRRHQNGYVFRHRRKWYVRFREDKLLEDGNIHPVQRCRPLGDAVGPEQLSHAQAKRLAEEMLRNLNHSRDASASMTLNRYLEQVYFPAMQNGWEASTYSDNRNKWLRYVKPIADITLWEFKPLHGDRMLREIAAQHNLSSTTLRHIKNLLSGAFRYACLMGILSGANPMREVRPPRGKLPRETKAYSLEQVTAMLRVLIEPELTLVATAALSGLSKSELRGLGVTDYDGTFLHVRKSVWRNVVKGPKTRFRSAPVPVIAPLAKLLGAHLARCGRTEGYLFSNSLGRPVNLDLVARQVIRPALAKAQIPWYGWHAFRRGLATNLDQLGVSAKVIQQILRHGNVATTMIYIKPGVAEASTAMKKLEGLCATIVQPQSSSGAQLM